MSDEIIFHVIRPYKVWTPHGTGEGTEILAEYKGTYSCSRVPYWPASPQEFTHIEKLARERMRHD